MKKYVPSILVLLSGFAGLVYQVLWMRQLGLLFGNTAHAAAMTLAVFFAGLTVGSWVWGRRVAAETNPFRTYAWLELGIALTALLYFGVLSLFYSIYPMVCGSVASRSLLLAVKCLLALLLVFPPAFFMGGTIPVIGQAVIRRRDEFGAKAAWLYALNTLGAALGAFVAGFYLVPLLGFRWTCVTAIGITTIAAAGAAALAGSVTPGPSVEVSGLKKEGWKHENHSPKSAVPVYAICFLSGFGFLALEVLWTRLLCQIHTNSVYSFACVLVIVLIALAAGAAAAAWLARWRFHPMHMLAWLLLAGGLSVALSPFIFMAVTNGFRMMDTCETLVEYVRVLFGKGAVVVGMPAFFLGIVFPFLMKVEESYSFQPGASLGRLSAINTAGAIAGSLLCGFLFLQKFGMWRTMQLIAALYLVAGMLLPIRFSRTGIAVCSAGAVGLVMLFTLLNPCDLRVTAWDPYRPNERELEVWETSDGTVSVALAEHDGCFIKLNSGYKLGSTGAAWRQHFQGRIPLLAYPQTRSIFFLGVGTGISAGASLDPRFSAVNRVVACEMVPEVITAARKYMTGAFGAESGSMDFTGGLFRDPRVEILVEDGRHFLMAGGEKFDMINADLFLPYRSGAGSLYSREHFENVKARLNPGGVFSQWLPMYQLTETEFGAIARTMLEVFDRVTMWRNNFSPGQEAVALFGHRDPEPLPACSRESQASRRTEVTAQELPESGGPDITYDEETVLVFYCGNLTAAKDLFLQYPVNTDDLPLIEYTTPLSLRTKVDGLVPTIVGPRYESLVDKILARCPPDTDPMLSRRTAANRRLVAAGTEFHRFWLAKATQDETKARNAWTLFVREWTDQGGKK